MNRHFFVIINIDWQFYNSWWRRFVRLRRDYERFKARISIARNNWSLRILWPSFLFVLLLTVPVSVAVGSPVGPGESDAGDTVSEVLEIVPAELGIVASVSIELVNGVVVSEVLGIDASVSTELVSGVEVSEVLVVEDSVKLVNDASDPGEPVIGVPVVARVPPQSTLSTLRTSLSAISPIVGSHVRNMSVTHVVMLTMAL